MRERHVGAATTRLAMRLAGLPEPDPLRRLVQRLVPIRRARRHGPRPRRGAVWPLDGRCADRPGQCVVITSSGGCVASSRLDSASAVELVVVTTRLRTPGAVRSGVTFTVVQVPAVTGPDDPTFVDAIEPAGWFAAVIPFSVHDESLTPNTSKPVVWALVAQIRSVAESIVPLRAEVSNFR